MNFGIFHILNLIGSLGLFIFGMKIMSEGIQRAAGNGLREVLKSMTKNRFFGVMTGFLVTGIIQSSGATTVMVVSFVNAGLMSVAESVGVIMGANIGTTITAWLVSILGFKNNAITFCLPIIALGFPMLFMKKAKFWGEFLIGFALLFMGLEELKNSVPTIENNPEMGLFLNNFSNLGFWENLIFIAIGVVLTLIIQSSSASMVLAITMCHQGLMPLESSAAMILGANIGTTITAHLAALMGNVLAKRAALIHSLFNIFGVSWMIVVMHYVLQAIDIVFIQDILNKPSSFTNSASVPLALSMFNSLFSILNMLLLIWFIPQLVKLSEKIVPSKGKEDLQHHLEFFPVGLVASSELSIVESKKEVVKFGEITRRMLGFFKSLLVNSNEEEIEKLISRTKKYEEITDKMEVEIVSYLIKISESELSEETTIKIRSQLSIVRDLERVADIFYQMTKVIERKREAKIWFTPEQRNNLMAMIILVDEAFELMIKNLAGSENEIDFKAAKSIEAKINTKRDELRTQHWINIENRDYDIKNGLIYSDLFSSLEKIGDQIINVSEALMGEI